MSIKNMSPSQLRKFRSDLALLKHKGLVSSKVDARSQKPTRHMVAQIKRFQSVIDGTAQVVHTKRHSQAVEFGARFDIKGKAIVIPHSKGERLHYSAKNHEITSRAKQNGVSVQKVYSPKAIADVNDLPQGPGILYTIRFGNNGGVFSFDTLNGLSNFLRSLSDSGWKDAIQFVEVTRGNREYDAEEFSEDFDDEF